MTLPIGNLAPPPAPAPERHHSTLGWFGRGFVEGLRSVATMMLLGSFIGFGALLEGVGFPLVAGMVSTMLIWALPAQVILIGGVVSGTALPAVALAVTLSSIRLLPMVVSIAPYMRGPRRNLLAEAACAHFVAMTMWVEGLRLLPRIPGEGRVPYTLGLGSGYVAISGAGTLVGYALAGSVPGPLAAGLLLLTPLSFTVLMVRNARGATDWLALGAGLALTPLTMGLAGGLDLMIAGVGGGTLAYLVGRRLEKRR
ncbi:AzlC family ABC transporter permease [Xanthobacter tagetidis]|nr:AzlC family ABC transporter permease [Xanthobacter tagetidis]MBB6308997.1 putative branched-subunit amino acid permease [Xanthobacter tagetidis]